MLCFVVICYVLTGRAISRATLAKFSHTRYIENIFIVAATMLAAGRNYDVPPVRILSGPFSKYNRHNVHRQERQQQQQQKKS